MKLKTTLRLFACAAILLGSSAAIADTATNNKFTTDQQTQIETIVHDYLVSHPQVLMEMASKLQEQQNAQVQQQASLVIAAQTPKLFSAPTSPVVGNTKGNVTLIEFFDYQCPHCKSVAPLVNALTQTDPNLRVVLKEFPIFGANSEFASRAALAAQQQGKYYALHTALMKLSSPFTPDRVLAAAKAAGLDITKLKADMSNPAINQELNDNLQLANQLGLPGTPGFIIAPTPTGKAPPATDKVSFIPGETDLANLKLAIAKARS